MNRVEEFIRKILNQLRLSHEQEDYDAVHQSIETGVVFKGTNLWILIFAILVACVGLNMNSTAVIIGAMLISPLMGPINGIGYAVAVYDMALLKKSIKNLGFAVGASLITSSLYFLLTPIHTEHAELLARTSPTIYDVFIAMFGGLAGIVALSSKNKGNVIPGVAIATALMPPLCTAGYGLAVGNWAYFLGALYLFIINSVFIALSSMVVSQLMKFPKRGFLLSKDVKNKNIAIGIVTLFTVVPSVFFGYSLVKKEEFKADTSRFIKKVEVWEGNYMLDHQIDVRNGKIRLVYGGEEMDEVAIKRLYERAIDHGIDTANLKIEQGFKVNDLSEFHARDKKEAKLLSKIDHLEDKLKSYENQVDSIENIARTGSYLLNEIKAVFPAIQTCAHSIAWEYFESDGLKSLNHIEVHVVLFGVKKELKKEDQEKVFNWLVKRLGTDKIEVRYSEV